MQLRSKIVALGLAGALVIVPAYEGTVLKTYRDPIGIPTACTGHTGRDVVMGQVYTPEQCEMLLALDLIEHNKVVDSCVTVPLNPNQRSAFVSFAFNVGPGGKGVKDGFCRLRSGAQPTFLKLLNAGQYAEACEALRVWNKAGGKVLRGLTLRRDAEIKLCMKEYLPLLPPSPPSSPAPSEPTRKSFWQRFSALWQRSTAPT